MRAVLLIVVAALVVVGCGGEEEHRTTAETEGLYLTIGDLKYQVQLSRYMNPRDIEDRDYFAGLPESTAQPDPDETWFGVWVRVQNETDDAHRSAGVWEIHDTQDNVFRPVPLDSPFAYRAGTVPPNSVWPLADSAAGQGPVQGQLLLFKVSNESLQNRPLELVFRAGQGEEGTYHLDV
jgi:hypothetical protein